MTLNVTPFDVRPAKPSDADALRQLNELTTAELRHIYRPTASAIAAKEQLKPTLTRLVAVAGDSAIGTVEYKIEDHRIHVIGLAVHPQWRRQGAARALLTAVAAAGKQADATHVSLYTIVQTGNVPLFEKLGFCAVRETPAEDLIGDRPLTETFMQRKID